jgi:hypothetical protein
VHEGKESISVALFAYNFRADALPMQVDSTLFVVVMVVGIFAVDMLRRWWKETEWKRRWRRDRDDED